MLKKISKAKKVKSKAEKIGEDKYILKLFVTGILPNSARAIININNICEKHLKGRYELEIIDIYKQPAMALSEDIVAIPLLIKKFPLPEERMIGDLSDIEMVLKALRII